MLKRRSSEGPLFTPVAPENQLAGAFADVCRHRGYRPARRAMAAEFEHFDDADGNFIEQFQTTGFDARVWELYLHAFFRDAGFVIERPRPAPDFLLRRTGLEFCLEATTANATPLGDAPKLTVTSSPAEIQQYVNCLLNAYPIRVGSPLYSKLRREYWNDAVVGGRPFVLALGDLSEFGSSSGVAIAVYLYGIHSYWEVDEDGQIYIAVSDLEKHVAGAKEIPSGFFRQEGSENISAVLFGSAGSVSKFNRLGHQGAWREPDVTMRHVGLRYNHDQGATGPKSFSYDVADRSPVEPWGEGLSIYYNPFALRQLARGFLPSTAEHQLIEGALHSRVPDFHPLASKTFIWQAAQE